MWLCLRPYSVVLIALCLVILGLFICCRADNAFSEVKKTPCSNLLSHKHSFLPFPPLCITHSAFLYRQEILLMNQIKMGMHGIPYIRWKIYIKKIIHDLLAHIGVKGTEWGSSPKWSSSSKKRLRLSEVSGQLWIDFYRDVAGFTWILDGQIHFKMMLHSVINTGAHSSNSVDIFQRTRYDVSRRK